MHRLYMGAYAAGPRSSFASLGQCVPTCVYKLGVHCASMGTLSYVGFGTQKSK